MCTSQKKKPVIMLVISNVRMGHLVADASTVPGLLPRIRDGLIRTSMTPFVLLCAISVPADARVLLLEALLTIMSDLPPDLEFAKLIGSSLVSTGTNTLLWHVLFAKTSFR